MRNTKKALARSGRGIILTLCFALSVLLCFPAAEVFGDTEKPTIADLVGSNENYSAVIYNNTNGLPTSEANDIAQTGEGFLWIGSYSGLIRYDGHNFERMDSTTGITSVVCLHVDKKDRLWIGTNDGGLAMMEQGEFRFWGEKDGLGSAKICAIEEDAEGVIYVGTTAGISIVREDMSLGQVEDYRVAGAYMEHMRLGSDGLIYCLTNEDDYFVLRNGKVVDYIGHTATRVQDITSILPDPENAGKFYIGTGGSGFYHGNIKSSLKDLEYVDLSPLFDVSDIRLIEGKIWICARNGIGMLDEEGFHHLGDLPMVNSVGHVMEDYQGDLWFTSSRQGVMKLVPNWFSDVFARYGLPERVVNAVCRYQGKLFIATDTGLMILGEEGPLTEFPLRAAKTASGAELGSSDLLELLSSCRIRSFVEDREGRLWISTWRANGLLRYENGEVTAFTEAEGLYSDHIRVVDETADGRILVACTGGVVVIEGDSVTARYGPAEGITNPESLSVVAAPNGDIVLGSNGGGIYIINEEGIRRIGTEEGLSSGIVMRVKYDAESGVYWIVTGNSIAWMTPDYQVTTVQSFPYSNNFDLYRNSKGEMWVLSSDGIYVASCEELLAGGEIRPVHYGMANGLPCIATSNSYSELTEEGDLYIAGNTGVAKVNIETPMEDISDVKQAVPFIEADGKMLYPGEDGGFTIPSRVRKLTVYAYVYTFSLTDPQVTYCLEGFDSEAVTVNRSELAPVSYTNLPGGSYRFTMELKDSTGQNSKTLSVPIEKEKALYEQVWFYVLSALGGILVILALVRAYVRRKMRLLEEKHREEAERERIENELSMANRIQHSMLPHVFPPFPDREEFDLYASMDPAKEVGGDFYDFFFVDEDHLCLVMADVSGKGVPGALFMMVSKAILQSFGTMGRSAAEILTKTNETICANNPEDMFVTVWLGILEISTGKIVAANAGHEYPVLKQPEGRFELIKDKHGFVIGGMDGVRYREYELELKPGAKLFLYTDGVPEAANAEKEMFGTERMLEALNSEPDAAPKQVLKNVRAAVDGFVTGAEQFDDLTMLCIEYKGEKTQAEE